MDWTGLKIATAPAVEPVTLTELKLFARIDTTAYDAMLPGYITACREALEKHTGRTFITTTYDMYLDKFPAYNSEIRLQMPPVQSVTSIYYNQESDGVLTLLASSLYQTDFISQFPRIIPAYDEEWPDTRDMLNAVKITYIAGYGLAVAVPSAIKECIKSLATDLFEHPESSVEVKLESNRKYEFLLNAYSIPGVI